MKQSGEIDNAVVFSEEIATIEEYSGVCRSEFLQNGRYPENHLFQTLKHREHGGCYFYRAGQCEVYSVRPMDCRLFPFDIIEDDDGELRWIVYTDLCPVDFDYRPAFEHVRSFFNLLEDIAWAYSEGHTPGMEGNNYIELDRVYPGART